MVDERNVEYVLGEAVEFQKKKTMDFRGGEEGGG